MPVCIFDMFLLLCLSARFLSVMATVYLSRHCILCATHVPSHVVTLAQTALPKALGSSALLVWQQTWIGQCQARANMTPDSVVCRAKDSYAQLASAWRLVQVQQQYAVTLTLPLTLSAANLTDAQAQADVLTATSNATDALESALAAGLISGEPVLDYVLLLLIGCWLVSACLKQIKHVLGIQFE